MNAVTQINVSMPNVPNSLARIGDKLRSVDVNIDAIACTEGGDNSVVHLVVNDADEGVVALKELGTVTTNDVLVFRMRNKPGAIGNIGRALGAANVNIRNMYATTWGKDATVYVHVDDIEQAKEGLESWKDDGGRI